MKFIHLKSFFNQSRNLKIYLFKLFRFCVCKTFKLTSLRFFSLRAFKNNEYEHLWVAIFKIDSPLKLMCFFSILAQVNFCIDFWLKWLVKGNPFLVLKIPSRLTTYSSLGKGESNCDVLVLFYTESSFSHSILQRRFPSIDVTVRMAVFFSCASLLKSFIWRRKFC